MLSSSAPMPLLSISSKETIEKCALLKLRPSDVFICSYPKSGTTWMQHIVLSLLLRHKANMKEDPIPDYNHVSDYAPFFEIDAHWEQQGPELASSVRENHARLGTRVFNTHLRFDMLPKCGGGGGRFIYLIRSPLDTCVSFYHHLVHQVEGGYEGTFAEFFQDWIRGNIAFGSWIHHILSYASAFANGEKEQSSTSQVTLGDGRKIFLVSYEEMIADLPGVVFHLKEFLELNVTPEQREEMLPSFSFQSMKEDLGRFQPQSVQWKNGFVFLRRGVAGDSSAIVSEQQRKDFRKWVDREKLEEILSELLAESNPQMFHKMVSPLAL